MHNGIAERPERKPLSVRDPVRQKLILDTKRENPSMKATEIAKIADCGPGYVRKVLKDVKPVQLRLTFTKPLSRLFPFPKQDMEHIGTQHKRSPGLRQIRNGFKGLWPIPLP